MCCRNRPFLLLIREKIKIKKKVNIILYYTTIFVKNVLQKRQYTVLFEPSAVFSLQHMAKFSCRAIAWRQCFCSAYPMLKCTVRLSEMLAGSTHKHCFLLLHHSLFPKVFSETFSLNYKKQFKCFHYRLGIKKQLLAHVLQSTSILSCKSLYISFSPYDFFSISWTFLRMFEGLDNAK